MASVNIDLRTSLLAADHEAHGVSESVGAASAASVFQLASTSIQLTFMPPATHSQWDRVFSIPGVKNKISDLTDARSLASFQCANKSTAVMVQGDFISQKRIEFQEDLEAITKTSQGDTTLALLRNLSRYITSTVQPQQRLTPAIFKGRVEVPDSQQLAAFNEAVNNARDEANAADTAALYKAREEDKAEGCSCVML